MLAPHPSAFLLAVIDFCLDNSSWGRVRPELVELVMASKGYFYLAQDECA